MELGASVSFCTYIHYTAFLWSCSETIQSHSRRTKIWLCHFTFETKSSFFWSWTYKLCQALTATLKSYLKIIIHYNYIDMWKWFMKCTLPDPLVLYKNYLIPAGAPARAYRTSRQGNLWVSYRSHKECIFQFLLHFYSCNRHIPQLTAVSEQQSGGFLTRNKYLILGLDWFSSIMFSHQGIACNSGSPECIFQFFLLLVYSCNRSNSLNSILFS